MRTYNTKYGVWLCGYYDDFTGARAVANDWNIPSISTSYDHDDSHHGNSLNGEAMLNPRFRWSYADRLRTTGSSFFSASTDRYLKNNGAFEWLGFDPTRNKIGTWGSRAQLQYPDGYSNANKFRFNGTSGEAYQLFTNGYKTSDFYVVPTGEMDFSYGRAATYAYNATNYGNKVAGQPTSSKPSAYMRNAHLAGVWMGETVDFTNTSNDTPLNLFAPLKSPSGNSFLCVRDYKGNSTQGSGKPTIFYEGTLNSALDNDVFSARVAVRSIRGSNRTHGINSIGADGKGFEYPTLQFRVGFAKPNSGLTNGRLINETGYSGTPAIDYTIDFYNNSLLDYDIYGAQYVGGSSQTYSNDNAWIDVDFVMNYTAGTYRVFINGIEDTSATFNLAGSPTATNMYGWEMFLNARNFSSGETGNGAYNPQNFVQYLMLDRVGLFHYITDTLHFSSDETPLKEVALDLNSGGISNGSMTLIDDPAYEASTDNFGLLSASYKHKLSNIVKNANDWEVLVFANEEVLRRDRPIFKGILNNYGVKQTRNTREIKINFSEPSSLLEHQLPLWEVGQKAVTNDSNSTPYWLYDAQGFKSLMNFGVSKLKVLSNRIGFDVDDGYTKRSDQRMQLNSAHPIQMYNNEDEHGPNSLELNYEGATIKGIYEKTVSGTKYTVVETHAAHGLSSGASITIKGTKSHNGTFATTTNTAGSLLYFAQGVLAYTPDTPKILYVGAFGSAFGSTGFFEYETWKDLSNVGPFSSIYLNAPAAWETFDPSIFPKIIVDADPGLKAGDKILINEPGSYEGYPLEVTEVKGPGRNFFHSTLKTHDASVTNYDDPSKIWHIFTKTRIPSSGAELGQYYDYQGFTGDTSDTYGDSHEVTNTNVNLLSAGCRKGWRIKQIDGVANGIPDGGPHFVTQVTSTVVDFDGNATADTSGQAHWVEGDGALKGSDRLRYSSDNQGIIIASGGNLGDISKFKYKALHTRWMRDLPLSLWFKYHFGIIQKVPIGTCLIKSSASPTSKKIRITHELYNLLKSNGHTSGIVELVEGTKVSHAIYRGLKLANPTGGDPEFLLTGIKFLNQTFSVAATANIVRFSDDYKHLWLLWADMRNDGNADADGGYRKSSFGLKYPTSDNYDVSLLFTDTLTDKGEAKKFTDLKIGEDIDIWDVDATSDPCTLNSFSKPADFSTTKLVQIGAGTDAIASNSGSVQFTKADHAIVQGETIYVWDILVGGVDASGYYKVTNVNSNDVTINLDFGVGATGIAYSNDFPTFYFAKLTGSNSDSDSKYHDWDTKAGAFLVIDSAKFFNLNTVSNGGRTGQESGGSTRLEEFVASIRGYPALIDNYYSEAIASPKNLGTIFSSHPNESKLKFESTHLTHNVNSRHTAIRVNDVSDFGSSGQGKINVLQNTGGSRVNDSLQYYCVWGNKLSSTLRGVITGVSGVTLTDTGSTGDGLKTGMMIENLSTGKLFEVTSDGASNQWQIKLQDLDTNVNGTWVVGDAWKADVQLSDAYILSPSQVLLRPENAYTESAFGAATGELIINTNPSLSSKTTNITTTNGAVIAIGSWSKELVDTFSGSGGNLTSTGQEEQRVGITKNYIFRNGLSAFGDTTLSSSFTGATETTMNLTDASNFDSAGSGLIQVSANAGDAKAGDWKLFSWSGKAGNNLTGVSNVNLLHANGSRVVESRQDPTHSQYLMVDGTGNTTATATDLVAAINHPQGNNEGTPNSRIIMAQNANQIAFEQTTVGSGGNRPIELTRYGNQSDFTSRRGMEGGQSIEFGVAIPNRSEIPAEINRLFNFHLNNDRSYNIPIDISNDSAILSNSLSPEYAFRMMMTVDGDVRSKNSGTYFEHDKFRTLWNAASMQTWQPPTKINIPIDINNIPVSKTMTYDGGSVNRNDFGSIIDTRGKTIGSFISANKKSSGYSDEGTYMPFTKVIGRDGRLDFRPKFNSGISLDRTNIKTSNIAGGVVSKVSNVRVYYDTSKAFVDYPSTDVQDTTKWAVKHYPKITNSKEALKVAKREYSAIKETPLKITAQPILDGNLDRKFTQSGRYGYIADPYRVTQGADDLGSSTGNEYWSRIGTGGCLFPGQVNALDGNQGAATDKDWRYGQSVRPGTGNPTFAQNYWWYGANSLAYALQIVHVPNLTPLTSTTTGNDLRVFISLKNSQTGVDIDNAKFTLHLVDYVFSDTNERNVSSVSSITSLNIYGNGFYEIDIPSTYGAVANAKLVVSINTEYLQSLLRHRCGDYAGVHVLKNAHVLEDGSSSTALSSITTGNVNSIFPLGGRSFTDLVPSKGIFQERTAWYAPRLHVTRDLSYWPGSHVTYTDHGLDLNNEVLTIQSLRWKFNSTHKEALTLTLERDMSLLAAGVESYLFPQFDYTEPTYSIVAPAPYTPPSFAQEAGSGDQPISSDDWIGQNPTDQGNNLGLGINDNTGDNYNDYRQGQSSINQIGSGMWADLRGFGSMTQDMMGSRGNFRILGQKRPGKLNASLKPLDADIELKVSEGNGIKGAEGYVFLPNSSPGGESGYISQTSFETEITVPRDIVSNQLELSGKITHGAEDMSVSGTTDLTVGNSALLNTLITNITRGGDSIEFSVRISTNTDNETTYLFPAQRVPNMTSGDRLNIKISRDPNDTTDTANFTSVVLHNLNIGMQRATTSASSSTEELTPYE